MPMFPGAEGPPMGGGLMGGMPPGGGMPPMPGGPGGGLPPAGLQPGQAQDPNSVPSDQALTPEEDAALGLLLGDPMGKKMLAGMAMEILGGGKSGEQGMPGMAPGAPSGPNGGPPVDDSAPF